MQKTSFIHELGRKKIRINITILINENGKPQTKKSFFFNGQAIKSGGGGATIQIFKFFFVFKSKNYSILKNLLK